MKTISEQEAKAILFQRGYNKTVTLNFPKGYVKEVTSASFLCRCNHYFWKYQSISGVKELHQHADKEYNLTPGDDFQLGAGIEHAEYTGEDGVTIVAAIPEKIKKRNSL